MKEETYRRDIHVIEYVATGVVNIHATVLSLALLCTD